MMSFTVHRWLRILGAVVSGLAAPFTASAVTACVPQWGTVEVLNPLPGRINDIKAGVDDRGSVHVAYAVVFDDDTREVLYVQRRSPDGLWQPAQVMYERPADAFTFTSVSLAVGPQGHALVAWVRSNTQSRRPEAASYDPANGWSAPVNLSLPDVGYVNGLVTQVNAHGRGLVAWVAQGQVLARHHHAQQGWGQTHRFRPANTIGGEAPYLSLAQNAAGEAVLAWAEEHPVASTYQPSSGWAAPTTLKVIGYPDFRRAPEAAIAADGKAVVTWSQRGSRSKSTKLKIWSAQWAPATGWADAVQISQSDRHAVEPAVASHNGRAAVIWNGVVRTSIERTKFSLYESTSGWSAESDATQAPAPFAVSAPFVHLSPSGALSLARLVQRDSGSAQAETSLSWWREELGKPSTERHPMGMWAFSASHNGGHQVLVDAQNLGLPYETNQLLPRARVATLSCNPPALSRD